MKIALAQIDPVVGDFEANARLIEKAYERACQAQARLLLTPELGVCGYPPHDLVERPEMFERTDRALLSLAKLTAGKKTALAVGHVARNESPAGRAARNQVTIFENGKAVFTQSKTLLPTYDIFDEARYFEPASAIALWECDGRKVAIAICEDLWAQDPAFERSLYGKDPVAEYQRLGAELVLSVSSSPYEWGKRERRESLHADIARKLKAPLLYINQVGANDEVLFDGGTFAVSAAGERLGRLPIFRPAFGVIDPFSGQWSEPEKSLREDQAPEEIAILTRGLIRGIRDYFARTGFKKAVLGLSGGIDSAVVAVLAAQALGPEQVIGIAMPSQFSSSHSLADADSLARALGIRFEVRPIKFSFSNHSRELSDGRSPLAPLALENLQARLRGVTVMTIANHENALALATGNKSELAQGYSTLYGDLCGALLPIGDLYKTRVYELARYLNAALGSPIPESTLTKAPSAELRPDQKDQDTLPPYEHLDALLEAYLEEQESLAAIEKRFGPLRASLGKRWIEETLARLERSEFKRRQAPPVLKASVKAFGLGRKIPVAKHWEA